MGKTFRSAVVAGICIGIAGFGNLAIGGIAGPVVFAFGLSSVVLYKLKLFTGTAGFIQSPSELKDLMVILAGNILGCLIVGLLARVSPLPIQESAAKILSGRLSAGILQSGLLAVGCGFIMTAAVRFARQNQWLPLVFGVPLFIFAGFPHSIADAFYYLAAPFSSYSWSVLGLYLAIVAGNFLGCNLTRLILWDKEA
ncbi:MAG: formate/nitrite transporter family protein [Bacteroidales bacterium]|nr:formate/nitrite transporter family protein [Bacteroidales bacterium]